MDSFVAIFVAKKKKKRKCGAYYCIRVLALGLTLKHLEQEKVSDTKAVMTGRVCNPRMIS